ncbi:MAG: hypothetical protein ACSHUF_00645 [Candidatus Nasuia deltocephalinicola]
MNIFIFNFNNLIFKKFLNFYSYKIILKTTNNNLYCYLFSFFKFNIIFSISTISSIIKNYILLNFGKNLTCKIYFFISKCFSDFILNLNILNLRFEILKKYSKNLECFFYFIKKYIYF